MDQQLAHNHGNSENIDPNLIHVQYDPLRSKKALIKEKSLKPHRITDKLREYLPYELQLLVTFYLSPRDIVLVMQNLSSYWRKQCKDQKLWTLLEKINPLSINERLLITQCLVERRSKGKLYKAIDRVTNETCLLRKIYLDVTNAG